MQRIVRLVTHLHLLIPSVRSSSIRPEEEALRSALEEIEEEVKRGGGGNGHGRLKAKLGELWAVVNALEAARERESLSPGRGGEPVEWAVVDPEGLQKIAQVRPHSTSCVFDRTF
jgi:nuclear pore complex protein Nup54